MTGQLVTYAPAVLAWAAVAYKLPAFRRGPHHTVRCAHWLTLLCLALALTVLLPPIYVRLDHLSSIPNLSRLLSNSLMLVACWTAQAFLGHLNRADERARLLIRRSGWALVCALVLMAVLFARAPVEVEEEAVDFTGRFGNAPFVMEYRLVFLASLFLALVSILRLASRFARAFDRPALSLGLHLVALGCLVGIGYAAHEGLRITTLRLGFGEPLPASSLITRALVAGAVVLTLMGSIIPAWGARAGIPALYRWVSRYRAYRRLYPLWRDLYQANPEIALLPAPSALADALTVRDLGFRLYRRVVEIRDGHLAVRPYLDPATAVSAQRLCQNAGLSGEEASTAIEAASLAAALRARAEGQLPLSNPVAPTTLGGADVRSEVAVLERVAHSYKRSPIVRAVLACRPG
ncbi:MAG: MAB_1171c family putative transporter [Dehalococcoidia bacterium]